MTVPLFPCPCLLRWEQREIGSIIIAFYGPIINMTRKHFIPNTLDGIEPWIFTKFQVLLWVILKKTLHLDSSPKEHRNWWKDDFLSFLYSKKMSSV